MADLSAELRFARPVPEAQEAGLERRAYFDGYIESRHDAQGRLSSSFFFDAKRRRQHRLEVDYAATSGTYSDESYCAETYAGGIVEEIHLGEVAKRERGVAIEDWVARTHGELLKTVAVFRIDWLLNWADERWARPLVAADHRDDFQICLDSYAWALEATGVQPDEALPMIQVGWGLCALVLGHRVEEARRCFRRGYPEVRPRLEKYEPLLLELLGEHMSRRFWLGARYAVDLGGSTATEEGPDA